MISLCGTSINAPPWEGREHGSERKRRKRGSLRPSFSTLRPSLEQYERRRKKRGSLNLANGLRTLTEICVIRGSSWRSGELRAEAGRVDYHGKLIGPQAGRLSLARARFWDSFCVLKSLLLFRSKLPCGQRKPNKENARITLANETVRSLGVSVGLAFVLILSCRTGCVPP